MTTQKFLEVINDGQGPLQTTATDVMERLSRDDFNHLIDDMTMLAAKDRHPVTNDPLDEE